MKSRFFIIVVIVVSAIFFGVTAKTFAELPVLEHVPFDYSGEIRPVVDIPRGSGDSSSSIFCAHHPELCDLVIVDPDADNDGVIDEDDSCPETPEDADVNDAGCPDTDGDGLYDDEDACADVAADTDNGCAVVTPEPDTTDPDPIPESDAGAPATEREDVTSCSLVQNSPVSLNSIVSIAVFAISLAPLTIRRKLKK